MEARTFPETLHFNGPFKFTKGGNYLFESKFTKSAGIYIWTIKDEVNNLNFIEYIGETPSFARRQKVHLIQLLGMYYRIISAANAKQGKLDILWKGLWRMKNTDAVTDLLEKYEELSHNVVEYVDLINIYFAETPTLDKNKRCHLEGSLGWNLRNKHPDKTTFYPADTHVGTRPEKYNETIRITTDEPIEGIDTQLMV